MFSSKFVTLIVAMLCVSVVCYAGRYEDTIQEVELNIKEKYRTPRAVEEAQKRLGLIIDNPDLTEDAKIIALHRTFLQKEKIEITEANAHQLIFVPDISWTIHSIAIAYDVDKTQEILVSGQKIDAESRKSSSGNSNEKSSKSTYDRSYGTKGGVKGELHLSMSPFMAFKSHARFDFEANASFRSGLSESEMEIWSEQRQKALSQQFEKITKQLDNTKISRCHLTFAITFKNNTTKDLFFNSNSTVPVYARRLLVLDTRPESNNVNTELKIAARSSATIKFRGEINNTQALQLLKFMTSDTPRICPEEGQIFIESRDGSIKNAVQNQFNNPVTIIRCGLYEWRVSKSYGGKTTTLREALWAINGLYVEPVFLVKNDQCEKIFGSTCGPNVNMLESQDYPIFEIDNKCFSRLSKQLLDSNLSNKDMTIHVFNMKQDLFTSGMTDIKRLLFDEVKEIAISKKIAPFQITVGEMYFYGVGVDKDYTEAVKWFRKAAEQGYAYAQYRLGGSYYYGNGVTKDYAEAVKWYHKAAEQGYAEAQSFLGYCYSSGNGVAKDYTEAVKWFRNAAEQGFAEAQFRLGLCYVLGTGVKQDDAEAVKWFRKAAEQGLAVAQVDLGYCYYEGNGVTKDYAEAVKWYRKATEQGDADAQWRLGDCYYKGNGVKQDYVEAVKWLRKAAEQKYAKAQDFLGYCYYSGNGVAKDYTEAVKWHRKAAEQGDAIAQFNLGYVYYVGEGVKQDYAEAVKLFRKAAEQKYAAAQHFLGYCYYYGKGVKQDYVEAVKWFRKAAEQKYAKAQDFLGYCYYNGNGVAKDYSEAVKWYRKAAEQGHAGAKKSLDSLR